jgi:hypothetical protein
VSANLIWKTDTNTTWTLHYIFESSFFVCHILITSHYAISPAAICLLATCVTAWTPTELVNVSLRFHTHVHVLVFAHQFCGFVYLNVYYRKLKNSILLIEFGEVCCRVERAWGAAGVGVMFNVQGGVTSQNLQGPMMWNASVSTRWICSWLLRVWC